MDEPAKITLEVILPSSEWKGLAPSELEKKLKLRIGADNVHIKAWTILFKDGDTSA